eukprot:tig00020563_g11301.t1
MSDSALLDLVNTVADGGPSYTAVPADKVAEIGSESFLPGWRVETIPTASATLQQIVKTFKFEDFRHALDFAGDLADDCDAAAHHPAEIDIAYNKVAVALSTYDCGCISNKDVSLASVVDATAKALKGTEYKDLAQLDEEIAMLEADIEFESLDEAPEAAFEIEFADC